MNGSYWKKLKQEREDAARKVAHDSHTVLNTQTCATIDTVSHTHNAAIADQCPANAVNGCKDANTKKAHLLFDVFRSVYQETLERMNP